MKYLKKRLDEEALDTLRINLSVREEKLSPESVCDFCADPPHPIVIYGASRMADGTSRECWRWAACETCEELIDSDNFSAVEDRIIARLLQLWNDHGNPEVPYFVFSEAVKKSITEFHLYSIKSGGEPN